MAQLDLQGVTKAFGGGIALQPTDLSVENGEFVVLVGPSGCGKTTLLRMVAGLDTPTSGVIRIGGQVVNHFQPQERDIAMVFQNYALYPHMRVRENLTYGLRLRGVPREETDRRVRWAAELLGLEALLERKPSALSGGQRQRVAMGRAIVREPQLFLFDEPLSNLDARLRNHMRVEIKQLHQRLQTTTLYVTHDQVEAMTLAQRVVVMNEGRIEQVGTPAEVYRRPASVFVAGFFGAPGMNLFQAMVGADGRPCIGDRILDSAERAAEPGPVVLGIRPEHLRVQPDGPLDLQVTLTEELGAETLVHGAVGGQACVLRLPSGSAPCAGDVVRLGAAPGDLHLFDPREGVRVDAAA